MTDTTLPESPHEDLIISQGDEEFWARCSCGQQLGMPIRPNESFDILAQRWDRHIHVGRATVGGRS